MTNSNADSTKAPSASITEDVSDSPLNDMSAAATTAEETLVGISTNPDGLDTGDSLVQALVQLGDGHSFNSFDAGLAHATDAASALDMSDVGAISDDLGSMLDQLGPSLDALISQVNLFDIAIAGDTLGDA